MDNFKMHTTDVFYDAFQPEEAKKLVDRFEFIFALKYGNALNITKVELCFLYWQCPDFVHAPPKRFLSSGEGHGFMRLGYVLSFFTLHPG